MLRGQQGPLAFDKAGPGAASALSDQGIGGEGLGLWVGPLVRGLAGNRAFGSGSTVDRGVGAVTATLATLGGGWEVLAGVEHGWARACGRRPSPCQATKDCGGCTTEPGICEGGQEHWLVRLLVRTTGVDGLGSSASVLLVLSSSFD